MEEFDDEEDSLGIRGKLAILLIVGAFGRMLDKDKFADVGVHGTSTVDVEEVDADRLADEDCTTLRRSIKFDVELFRSKEL